MIQYIKNINLEKQKLVWKIIKINQVIDEENYNDKDIPFENYNIIYEQRI